MQPSHAAPGGNRPRPQQPVNRLVVSALQFQSFMLRSTSGLPGEKEEVVIRLANLPNFLFEVNSLAIAYSRALSKPKSIRILGQLRTSYPNILKGEVITPPFWTINSNTPPPGPPVPTLLPSPCLSEILKLIASLSPLEELHISDVDFGSDAQLHQVATMFGAIPSANSVYYEMALTFYHRLLANRQLRSLELVSKFSDLSRVNVGRFTTQAIAEALPSNSSINALTLYRCGCDVDSLGQIVNTLKTRPGPFSLTVCLGNALLLASTAEHFAQVFSQLSGLVHLSLSDCSMTQDFAKVIAPSLGGLTSLESLSLSYNPLLSAGLALFVPALTTLPKLEKLLLRDCHLDSSSWPLITQLVQGVPSLRSLDISLNNYLNETGNSVPTFGSALRSLAISNFTTTPALMESMVDELTKMTSLESLEWQGFQYSSSVIHPSAQASAVNLAVGQVINSLGRFFLSHQTLTSLDLSGTLFDQEYPGETFLESPTLQTVRLSKCHFSSSFSFALATGLGRCPALVSLDLSHTPQTHGTLGRLVAGLKNSTAITHLDVSQTHLNDFAAGVLRNLLEGHRTLLSLNVSFNTLGLAGMSHILTGLLSNNVLRSLRMEACTVPNAPAPEGILPLLGNLFLTNSSLQLLDMSRSLEFDVTPVLDHLRQNTSLLFFYPTAQSGGAF
ncbi:hypothetical protein H696_00214 [Fonticula alba]|uniref:Uncharacterized protein n=1 Tax=Fonticula alba TaxID=691883 RepID=A0A058ZE37_FONAL|nr:hypothetical protein H696_00214 [Fonticula alba]KCV72629.1 hypothetical protein H696_00214 [Fonticula alba]|eukprot:XP_009492330.1 hypothetical protein H696_00214 [Fonticula alba]